MKLTSTKLPEGHKHLCDWCNEMAVHEVHNHTTDWLEYACDKHLEEHCSQHIDQKEATPQ